MPNKADLSYALNLKPEKAIKYFESRGYNITFDWHEMWQEAHTKAFTVSRVTQVDVLKDIRESLQKSLNEGMTYKQFQKDIIPKLQAKGWYEKKIVTNPEGKEKRVDLSAPWRLKTIYRTNIQTAYMTGRYKEQLANVDIMPYWEYVAILDSHTRPQHKALNGKILRYDDPFWDSFYPPNGWGCRCRVRSVDDAWLKERDLQPESSDGKLSETYQLVSKKTGEMAPVSVYKDAIEGSISPDVGWSYNSGKFVWNIDVYAYSRIKDLPADIKTKFITEMANSNINKPVFSNIVDKVNQEKMKRGIEQTVGWIDPETLDYLSKNKAMPQTPVITMSDQAVLHSIREVKSKKATIAGIEEMKSIPDIISKAETVIYDKQDPALIYVVNSDKNKVLKIVVKLNKNNKKTPVNYIVTVSKIDAGDLKAKRYEVIKNKK